MSAGCPNHSTVSHIIISSHRLTGFSTLCLAATSSEAERIPLDYPKHLTRKWGVSRTFLKKQLLSGSVSQFHIEERHTNIQPPLRQKVNFFCLSLVFRIQVIDVSCVPHFPSQRGRREVEIGQIWCSGTTHHCLNPESIMAAVDESRLSGRGSGNIRSAGPVLWR